METTLFNKLSELETSELLEYCVNHNLITKDFLVNNILDSHTSSVINVIKGSGQDEHFFPQIVSNTNQQANKELMYNENNNYQPISSLRYNRSPRKEFMYNENNNYQPSRYNRSPRKVFIPLSINKSNQEEEEEYQQEQEQEEEYKQEEKEYQQEQNKSNQEEEEEYQQEQEQEEEYKQEQEEFYERDRYDRINKDQLPRINKEQLSPIEPRASHVSRVSGKLLLPIVSRASRVSDKLLLPIVLRASRVSSKLNFVNQKNVCDTLERNASKEEVLKCIKSTDEYKSIINKKNLNNSDDFIMNINSTFANINRNVRRVDFENLNEMEDIDYELNNFPIDQRNTIKCHLLLYVTIKKFTIRAQQGINKDRVKLFTILQRIIELQYLSPMNIIDVILYTSGYEHFGRIIALIQNGELKNAIILQFSLGLSLKSPANLTLINCAEKAKSALIYFINSSLQELFIKKQN
jgi:flagellar motor protein MotB